MSLTVFRCGGRGWSETDAAALAVADVVSIRVQASTVRAVIEETLRRHGGPAGVTAELHRRLDRDPVHTDRTLAWARHTLTQVQP